MATATIGRSSGGTSGRVGSSSGGATYSLGSTSPSRIVATLGNSSPGPQFGIGQSAAPPPQQIQSRPVSNNQVLGAQTNTGWTAGAQRAGGAAPGVDMAKVTQGRSAIKGLVNSMLGVYDALYGDINNVARDKTNQVADRYNLDLQSQTDQFNEQFPAIGQAYQSRGSYDSSYRMNAEEAAQNQFKNNLGALAQGRDQDLAGVGQFVAQQQADINAQKGGVQAILAQIDQTDDVNELTQLRNTLDERLRSVQAARAGAQSQGSYLSQLNAVVPAESRVAGLQQNLTNVINSQVPSAVKRTIGQQLIQNAGIPQSQVADLLNGFNAQIADEDRQQVA